jgi:hypothetical protein
VRDEITATMGGDALVDAVAVSANFHMMTRVADGTGTGLDEAGMERLEVVREHIGVDDLPRCGQPAGSDWAVACSDAA